MRGRKRASQPLIAGLRAFVAALILGPAAVVAAPAGTLAVCADPNNLPFSDRAGNGFENKIAALLASQLNRRLAYTWWTQQRGFARKTLGAGKCDVWLGVASGLDNIAASRPYYRSTYVFVSRTEASLQGLTLDDPRLHSLVIGVQLIGSDAMNTPPAGAIAARGITNNVRGYMVYGDRARPDPAVAIIEALANRQIDVALVWGPVAGYFAGRSTVPLRLEAVTPAADPRWPMQYDICIGVRAGNRSLLEEINRQILSNLVKISAILASYHVPLVSQDSIQGVAAFSEN